MRDKLRVHIHAKVKNIKPYDQLEKEHIEDTLQWIESGAPLFRVAKPDKPPKHLVSYFVVIDPDRKSLLLVDHINAQLWLPSGGHVKPNEDPNAAVVREMKEELNAMAVFLHGQEAPFFLTINQTVGLTPGHTDVSLWYLLQGSVYDSFAYNKGEFNDIEWFAFDEIQEADPVIFDRHMTRFMKKLIVQKRFK